jgi:hypothetical protein
MDEDFLLPNQVGPLLEIGKQSVALHAWYRLRSTSVQE